METPQREPFENIRAYFGAVREGQIHHPTVDASQIEARLEQTVKELQARVREQQTALDKLRADSRVHLHDAAYASQDERQKLQQLQAVKDAYQRLTPVSSATPSPHAVLPALLAARSLRQNIQETKRAIVATQDQVNQSDDILRGEQVSFQDASVLTQSMEDRIERLRSQHRDRSQKTPAQLVRDVITAKRAQKDRCNVEMQRLAEAMNEFINDYLSSMVAAEELGGPVVGDMLEVESDTLAVGFTKKGRAKSSKKPVSDLTRQRRIDQIWGTKSNAVEDGEDEPATEAEAADADMRQLIENLFATLLGPGGGKAYFQLERDSAASRFLVRAKVAQFHPKNAMKLRLIDFGRELED